MAREPSLAPSVPSVARSIPVGWHCGASLPVPEWPGTSGSGLSAYFSYCPPCMCSRGAQVAPSRSPGVSDQRFRRRFQDPRVHLAWATLGGRSYCCWRWRARSAGLAGCEGRIRALVFRWGRAVRGLLGTRATKGGVSWPLGHLSLVAAPCQRTPAPWNPALPARPTPRVPLRQRSFGPQGWPLLGAPPDFPGRH